MYYIHSLHEKYGLIVLIAPAEVSCSSLPSFRTIHRISKPYLKSPWYQNFVSKPANLFTMIDPKEHAGRRKLFASAFSKSSLKTNWESEVRKKVEMAVEKIKKNALEGEVDILKFWTFMSTDVVGHHCFGESFKALEKEQSSQYITDLQHAGQVAFIRAEFPNLVRIGGLFKFSFLETPNERILGYGSVAVQNARSNIDSGASNIFQKVLAEGKTENGEGLLTDQDIQKQAAGFIIAGTDTTALSLTYLVYNILKNPGLQKQLEDEVDKLPENFESKDVEELELLNATIDEGLRLWAAAPGSLPRIVPKEGAQLDGYYVPGDIAISTQAYTIHRDPEIFPEPERYNLFEFQSILSSVFLHIHILHSYPSQNKQ
ncbi:hypothetical protein EAE96_002781 [Botrytis aclada]|nr:hypothetical protein EAE96_002781 [Botrytis aclada]